MDAAHLEYVPVDDWPARVVDHLRPVLLLELLAVVAEEDFADGVRAADAVVVQHSHLQVHLSQHACNAMTEGRVKSPILDERVTHDFGTTITGAFEPKL